MTIVGVIGQPAVPFLSPAGMNDRLLISHEVRCSLWVLSG